MDYQELKFEIEEDLEKIARKIEQFCTIDNSTYTRTYKKSLFELNDKIEELLNG